MNYRKLLKDPILHGAFFSSLFLELGYPSVYCSVMQMVDSRLISIREVILCLGTIMVNSFCIKRSDQIYKLFPLFCCAEILLFVILMLSAMNGYISLRMYYIIEIIIVVLISKNINCAVSRIKSICYMGERREWFDNFVPILCSVSVLLANVTNIVTPIPRNVAFIMMLIGIGIDNIFYYIAYKKQYQGDFKNEAD